jgi:hypothetical protein
MAPRIFVSFSLLQTQTIIQERTYSLVPPDMVRLRLIVNVDVAAGFFAAPNVAFQAAGTVSAFTFFSMLT